MEKKTVLIVDDSVVRILLKEVLEADYHVLEASTCREVIELLKNPIDLALIEFNLPDAYGSEVLSEIRKVNPELPVIFMGHSSKTFEINSIGDETIDFIQKPFHLASLKKKVAEMIKGNK